MDSSGWPATGSVWACRVPSNRAQARGDRNLRHVDTAGSTHAPRAPAPTIWSSSIHLATPFPASDKPGPSGTVRPGPRNRVSRRKQGARERRQVPVRAYAKRRGFISAGRRASLLIRWSAPRVRFWTWRGAAVRSTVPQWHQCSHRRPDVWRGRLGRLPSAPTETRRPSACASQSLASPRLAWPQTWCPRIGDLASNNARVPQQVEFGSFQRV